MSESYTSPLPHLLTLPQAFLASWVCEHSPPGLTKLLSWIIPLSLTPSFLECGKLISRVVDGKEKIEGKMIIVKGNVGSKLQF